MAVQAIASSAVLVHFMMKLEDGMIADSTRSSCKPALFLLGDGSLSAPLEEQLLGLHTGDTCTFTLLPQAAFSAENPDLIQFFSPRDFTEICVPMAVKCRAWCMQ